MLLALDGASAHEQANTIEALGLALRLGADGFDVSVRADGSLATSAPRRSRLRLGPASPPGPGPSEVAALAARGATVVVRVIDETTVTALVDAVMGVGAVDRLWLSSPEREVLEACRRRWPDVGLIERIRLRAVPEGPERRAADLRKAGIDAVAMEVSDWSAGLVALFHRFGRGAFAGPARHEREVRDLLGMGVDAVSSAHVDRMADARSSFDSARAGRSEAAGVAERPEHEQGPANQQ